MGIYLALGATTSYNDVWGNWTDYFGCSAGPNDISLDPLFVDPAAGNYHLLAGFPCIDAGSNAAPGLPSFDFDGEVRVWDGDGDTNAVVDMGADEYRAPEELAVLIGELIDDESIDARMEVPLLAKVNAALAALERGNSRAAINNLQALIDQVDAQTGKKITLDAAEALIAKANAIIAALGG